MIVIIVHAISPASYFSNSTPLETMVSKVANVDVQSVFVDPLYL